MEQMTVTELYTLKETIASEIFAGVTYPWEVLPKIGAFIVKLGSALPETEYEKIGEDIWVAKSAKVAATASIHGPAIIGKEAEIRHCAFIRGNAIVGEGAVVGNSTELKNVILFNKVQVPHYNYVGDSILGYKSHMGAGAVTSNVKSDKSLVKVKVGEKTIETGLKKFGAMLGDEVEVGCGSVLNPGSVIGSHTNIYPLSMVRGVIPAGSIYKKQGRLPELPSSSQDHRLRQSSLHASHRSPPAIQRHSGCIHTRGSHQSPRIRSQHRLPEFLLSAC